MITSKQLKGNKQMKTKLFSLAGAILATSLTFGMFMIPIHADAQTQGRYYEHKDQLTGEIQSNRYVAVDPNSNVRVTISKIKNSSNLDVWVSRQHTITDCRRFPIRLKTVSGQVITIPAKEFQNQFCAIEVPPEMIIGKFVVELPSYSGLNYIGNYDASDLDTSKLFSTHTK